tara:strand:- start:250 stop:444 length:195 start_codon:yes stop_codon:yes gene_type:complete
MTWGELLKYMKEKNMADSDFLRETVYVWNVERGEFLPADLLETGKDDDIIGGNRLFISIKEESS